MRRRLFLTAVLMFFLTLGSWGQFTFSLVDDFESSDFPQNGKWWRFGNLKAAVVANQAARQSDELIAGSGGEFALRLTGGATDWYVGGVGTDLAAEVTGRSRFQLDVSGNNLEGGKLIIELFNGPDKDDKLVAEAPILGAGVTRISIPISAFRPVRGKAQKYDLTKLQLVAVAGKKDGKIDCQVDNILLTY